MSSKKKEPNAVRLIRKANQLVEGKYRFDIWEMRVFSQMLTMIYKDDEDFKEYRIYLKDIIQDFNIEKDKQSYKYLKLGAEKLTKREIRVILDTEDGEMELVTNLAIGAKSFVKESEGRYIDISFHPDMKPLLLQLQEQFLMYDIRNILGIQSSFSIRIYELLKQYEKIGKRRFSIQELKEMLDVADKYPLYANFKQRVLMKAQEDLEALTDIGFTIQEIKRGKSVSEIVFHIYKNQPTRNILGSSEETPREEQEDPIVVDIFSRIKKYTNSNISTVKGWLNTYPSEYVKQRIAFVENLGRTGKAIRNPMGLIQTMLLQPDLFDPVEDENQKVVVKQENQKLQKEKEQQKEEETKRIKQEYEENKKVIIKEIFEETPTLVKDFLHHLRTLRKEENPSLFVEFAHDNYQTNIAGIKKDSVDELLYNYSIGSSFSAFLLDWLEANVTQYNTMRQHYEEQIKNRGGTLTDTEK